MRRPFLVAALLAWAALTVASVPLFILHDGDTPERADAIVVLAGDKRRLPVALELWERGVAPVLVISDGLDPRSPRARELCRTGPRERVLCPSPDPYSTRGEAQLAGRLAAERDWASLVVVSSRFHLFRAGRLFERCVGGELALVPAPNPTYRLPLAIGLEWAKLAVAAVRRDC